MLNTKRQKITFEEFVDSLVACEKRMIERKKKWEDWIKEREESDDPESICRSQWVPAIELHPDKLYYVYNIHYICNYLGTPLPTFRRILSKYGLKIIREGVNATRSEIKNKIVKNFIHDNS